MVGTSVASFTMTAFTQWPLERQTRLFGTLGELRGDGRRIVHYDFFTFREEVIEVPAATTELLVHSDGDYLLMKRFVEAVTTRDQGKVGEARELSAPVYGWFTGSRFTEGFDTRDLKEAS